MHTRHPSLCLLILLIALLGLASPDAAPAAPASPPATPGLAEPSAARDDRDATLSPMRSLIEHQTADSTALRRRYDLPDSGAQRERLRRFYDEQLRELEGVDFDALDAAGRIDYVLLRNKLSFERKQVEHRRRQFEEVAPLVPFAGAVIGLEEARERVEPIDPEQCARVLRDIDAQVGKVRAELEARSGRAPGTDPAAGPAAAGAEGGPAAPTAVLANRAAETVDRLRSALRDWEEFYAGYDPLFTWWMRDPYPRTDERLKDYADFLRRRFAGFGGGGGGKETKETREARGTTDARGGRDGRDRREAGDRAEGAESLDGPVIGDPIGRDALLDALAAEMIPYTPEELIDLAEKEFDWCEVEMKRAARDLGCGDDWHKALDKVSAHHLKPGEQPLLIKQLAEEATKYVQDHDLVTVPPLCKETWRMEMMSPQRQKVNPYFTGGEVISVSYPTDAMSLDDKLMSLRGNNPAFCRATVLHELIPGHHLQGFMARRYNAHRREFSTPFFVEGWALYWELKMWDLGFPRTAEDRVGMLFWRAHRCARILFSLKFHLGRMTAPQAIDFLVDRVGHERRNATAEVRRSVNGSYPPLYQAAYLLGGLQLRSLHKELVASGKMSERQFNDAVLRENAIPVELIRASLTGQKLSRDFKSTWRFYDEKEPPTVSRPAAERR